MRPSQALRAPVVLPFLLPIAYAVNLDCSDIPVDGHHYNFKELGGPHWVNMIEKTEFGYKNTTFSIDLCKSLPTKSEDKGLATCKETGTRICGIVVGHNDNSDSDQLEDAIEVAGDYTMQRNVGLDPTYQNLRDSQSSEDQDKDGIRAELHGGLHPFKKGGTKQMAVIEFFCDKDRTGNEDVDGNPDDKDDGDDENEKKTSNRSLQLLSYKDETKGDSDVIGVLRLKWRTKFACADHVDEPSAPGGHWGFFTWFIIIVFLGASSYLIFGAWLNYNRYGARGWDLVPHGDTIRDIPYVMKGWMRSASNAGSRGGYSAV